MGQLGIGVLIKHLAGNHGSVDAYNKAVNKVISKVSLGQDDALHFEMADGTKIKVADEGQSCCESRYMRTDDSLVEFSGATLLGMEIKSAPDSEDDHGESHEVQFLEVNTSKGVFTMSSHNEHNGYYGGFSIRATLEE